MGGGVGRDFTLSEWIEIWEEPSTIFLVAQGFGNYLFQAPTYVTSNAKFWRNQCASWGPGPLP